MTIDPEQIHAEVEARLAQLSDTGALENPDADPSPTELETIARQLSEAHDVLLRSLESAEKG